MNAPGTIAAGILRGDRAHRDHVVAVTSYVPASPTNGPHTARSSSAVALARSGWHRARPLGLDLDAAVVLGRDDHQVGSRFGDGDRAGTRSASSSLPPLARRPRRGPRFDWPLTSAELRAADADQRRPASSLTCTSLMRPASWTDAPSVRRAIRAAQAQRHATTPWRVLARVCAMLAPSCADDDQTPARAGSGQSLDGSARFLEGNRRVPRSRHSNRAAMGARGRVARASPRARQARQHLRAARGAGRMVGKPATHARVTAVRRDDNGDAPCAAPRARDAHVGHDQLAGALVGRASDRLCLGRRAGRDDAANLGPADRRRGASIDATASSTYSNLSFSPDEHAASCSRPSTRRDQTSTRSRRSEESRGSCNAARASRAISPDGRWLASIPNEESASGSPRAAALGFAPSRLSSSTSRVSTWSPDSRVRGRARAPESGARGRIGGSCRSTAVRRRTRACIEPAPSEIRFVRPDRCGVGR